MYINRTIQDFLSKSQFPVLLLTGPRQVGKTTLLKHLAGKSRSYVTLDDPSILKLAKEEPKLFFDTFQPPILIDEIQYATDLFPFIKMQVDNEPKAGQFWMTGSQQFHLMKGVSESLAGRIGILNLLGLSLQERRGAIQHPFLPTLQSLQNTLASSISLKELYTVIWGGSFPSIVLKDLNWNTFYSSYVKTYLQRDVRDLAKVGNEISFLKFLTATAARTGQLLNISDLARDANISINTAKAWLSILEASGIIYFLEPYFSNITKRLVKAPKLYFLDTGLCCYLTSWLNSEALEAGAMSGAILETFVVTEIIKSYWHNGLRAPIYFIRDKDKKEIDLVIIQNQVLYPLEIKKTAAPSKYDVKNFSIIAKFGMNVGEGGIICLIDKLLPIKDKIYSIPISYI